ncbi:MAG: TIGR04282 family arsenosugar biosynthesis glycosyltransferase [Bryobacteraceae bacterium]
MPRNQARKAGAPKQARCTREQNRGLGIQFSTHVVGIPVCIFAKPPVPGRVKTRLACAVGPDLAAELARAMLHDVWWIVMNATGVTPMLAATEPGDFGLDVTENRVWPQQGADLGCRIESILQRGLQIAPAAIAVGADTPLLTAGDLTDAMEQLELGNAVLGPSDDGGFYLLGLRSCPSGALAGIPWSCARTCEITENRLGSCGMSVARVRSGFDVDTMADIQKLRWHLQNLAPEIAPRTRECLKAPAWSAS